MSYQLNYFTYKFLIDHVEVLGKRDEAREAKKKAERRYQARSVDVNTVICLWPKDLIRLVGEISSRQAEYAAQPDGLFLTQAAYTYYERQGKRAKEYGPRKFLYGVKREQGGALFKMHHFAGIA